MEVSLRSRFGHRGLLRERKALEASFGTQRAQLEQRTMAVWPRPCFERPLLRRLEGILDLNWHFPEKFEPPCSFASKRLKSTLHLKRATSANTHERHEAARDGHLRLTLQVSESGASFAGLCSAGY